MSNPQPPGAKTRRVAYTIIERGEGKSYWLRVGTAFENRDGSLNVYLDAVPVNGRLQIREYQPDDDREAGAPRGQVGGQAGGQGGQDDRHGGRRFHARGA